MNFCPLCGELSLDDGVCSACAALATEPVDGRYQPLGALGRGGFGVVERARDLSLGRLVALKWLDEAAAAKPNRKELFRAEAAALASVRNEHVVQVYAVGEHRGRPYIAMELVDGVALDLLLRELSLRKQRFPWKKAFALAFAIADAAEAVHRRGLVHRDIKPANVLVENFTGRAVLVDFGLARSSTARARDSLELAGTPHYAPPEQLLGSGAALTGAADVYAWASTVYELLTGQLPFDGEPIAVVRAKLREAPPPPSVVDRALAPFDDFFARALAPEQEQRFSLMSQARDALERRVKPLLEPSPQTPAPSTQPELAAARAERTPHVLVVCTAPTLQRVLLRAAQVAAVDEHLEVGSAPLEALLGGAARAKELLVLDPAGREAEVLVFLTRLSAREGASPRVCIFGGSESFAAAYSLLGVEPLSAELDFVALVARLSAACKARTPAGSATRQEAP